tara:strand:- start:554 stop:919 length:366 start_codon:yes stop_codon:yes gene_type:complete
VTSKPPKYRSKFERQIASQLRDAGVRFEYETTRLGYVRKCTYTPDFILSNGIVIEAKGFFKASDRTKMVAVKEANPLLDIRFVFQNARVKLSRNSDTSYGEWAEKKGFLWAHQSIPEEWIQ